MIVTGELLDNVGSRKFVPIVYRDAEFSECIPVFLKTRLAARL
jgi:hypothetical protein